VEACLQLVISYGSYSRVLLLDNWMFWINRTMAVYSKQIVNTWGGPIFFMLVHCCKSAVMPQILFNPHFLMFEFQFFQSCSS
jgi:hypothetical protein